MNDKVNFLQQMPLFADLDAGQLGQIARDIVQRHYQQGDIIFREGDAGQVVYLVAAGQVRIFVNGWDGGETSVILFGRPGDMFGELAVVDGLPRSATAVALDDTDLYLLTRENFRRHMAHCPQLALNFMKVLSTRVRYNTQQMDSLASLGIPQRLARKLMELAQSYGRVDTDGVQIDVSLTQTDLASLIGATRESTNKSLRDFRNQQWIHMKQGRIVIRDPDSLRALIRI
ncbi:MAG: Crp/Fnr family transcriptional regulator [Anaerolinea sp.]|nr:Crp/Fnr family transcriptional regulator [Anaerolinea sp.]